MFGLATLKEKLITAVIAVAVIAATFFYIKYLQSEIQVMRGEILTLNGVVEAKNLQIDTINKNVQRMTEIQSQLAVTMSKIQNDSNNLRRKFEEDARGRARDLARIAVARPGLVENTVNAATRDALRCNELVTGAPVTEEEKTGKTKNSICQELLK